jgi:hypothetical protein
MKKVTYRALFALAVLLVVLTGCSFEPRGSGSIDIRLPTLKELGTRPVKTSSSARGELEDDIFFRLYLEDSAGNLLPIGENDEEYIQGMSGDTLTIGDVPAGTGYRLYASLYYPDGYGTEPDWENDAVWRYGVSEPITVSALRKSTAKISVKPREWAFESVKYDQNVSALSDGMMVYTLSENTVELISQFGDIPENTYTVGQGYTARSLSMGLDIIETLYYGWDGIPMPNPQVWVNTKPGGPRGYGVYYDDPPEFLSLIDTLPELDTDHSGALHLIGLDEELQTDFFSLLFYQGEGRLLGAFCDRDDQSGEFMLDPFDFTEICNVNNLSQYIAGFDRFSGVLGGTEPLIADFSLHHGIETSYYAYVVPSPVLVGAGLPQAIRIGDDVFQAYLADVALGDFADGEKVDYAWLSEKLFTDANTISVDGAVIRSVVSGSDIFGDGDPSNVLYIGTDRGVYTCEIDQDGQIVPEAVPTLIEGTEYDIVKVRAKVVFEIDDLVTYGAAITRNGTILTFRNGELLDEYPFCAGFPRNPRDLSFFQEHEEIYNGETYVLKSTLKVIVVGDRAVAAGVVAEWDDEILG